MQWTFETFINLHAHLGNALLECRLHYIPDVALRK